ncbi:MAG: hypothetical protein R6U02_08690 [Alkalibacterium sp.]
MKMKEVTEPNLADVAVYKGLTPIYHRLSYLFEEGCDSLTAFQKKIKFK